MYIFISDILLCNSLLENIYTAKNILLICLLHKILKLYIIIFQYDDEENRSLLLVKMLMKMFLKINIFWKYVLLSYLVLHWKNLENEKKYNDTHNILQILEVGPKVIRFFWKVNNICSINLFDSEFRKFRILFKNVQLTKCFL